MALRKLVLAVPLVVGTGCEDIGGINIFSIQDDKDLGAQLADEILADPATYPILDENSYPDAYDALYEMRDELLATGQLQYADEFDWQVSIIDDDETLNAFAAPGGYIYVYTGLMRYLDYQDYFMGVLGHEMAHADERHSTQQLTKLYGMTTLLGVILGDDPGLAAEIAASLLTLSFSRTAEAEADSDSVYYLCETDWAANGAAGFFEELLAEGGTEIPEFLSTHPSSESRVADINALADELGCDTSLNAKADWQAVLDALP
ncbi:MAG: M48 family metalloprotease [Oligoflexia bacterium]|nr:M48 family metalloprotease [Oligoflexia bacterium]